MAKSKNGPRSNFSLLPFELQYKIISMIQDGATFATIAADSEIAEAYRSRGLKLTAPAISRLKKSEQYKAWTDQRLKERSSFTADRLTTAFLRENDSLDTIAEQTKVALLKLVQECVAGAEDTKEVERLVRSAATLSNTAKDNQIADLRRKLERADAEIAELKAELAEREVHYREELAKLLKRENSVADPERVADELANILGVRKHESNQ